MQMNIPAVEGGSPARTSFLPFSPPDIHREEIAAVEEVLKSKWITRGERCAEFERMFSEYTGAGHAVVLNSATAGLFLCMKIAGIGAGDEVVTSPYTFAATANVILHTGAKPVFADIEEQTFCISPSEIEKRTTRKTRAVIPVHFAGHPAPLKEIRALAGEKHLLVVEDAAHAIGAELEGEKIGNGEGPAVFSFHAVKNLTTAEGGAVTSNDDELIRLLRLHSLHGQTKDAFSKLTSGGWKYDIALPGYKFNMTDIQAALGIEQLRRLEANRKKREKIARSYTEFFSQYEIARVPVVKRGVRHAWHLYPLRLDFSGLKIGRDALITALAAENISSNVHFIPLHLMSYYKKTFGFAPKDFPRAYRAYLNEVSLPLYPAMSEDDISDVIEAFSKLLRYYKK